MISWQGEPEHKLNDVSVVANYLCGGLSNFSNWWVSSVFTICLEFIKELLFWNSHQTLWKTWAVLDLNVCPIYKHHMPSMPIDAQQTSVQLSWIIWLYTKSAPLLVCVTASQNLPDPSIALHAWLGAAFPLLSELISKQKW